MERKADDPPGYFSKRCPFICLSSFCHMPCERCVFLVGWSMVVPPDTAGTPNSANRRMYGSHGRTEGMSHVIKANREIPVVTATEVCQDTRGWIRD